LGARLFWFLYLGIFGTALVKLPGGIYLSTVIFLFLYSLIFLQGAGRGRLGVPRDQLILFVAFLVVVVNSLYINADVNAVRGITLIMIFYTGVFFPYLALENPREVGTWFKVVTVGCLSNALTGLVQSIMWILTNGFVWAAGPEFFRVKGSAASPVDYVMMLMIGLCMAGAIPSLWPRRLMMAFYSIMLLICMSRSGLVVLFLVQGIYFLSTLRSGKRALGYIGVLFCVMVVLIATGATELIFKRITDIGNLNFNIKRFATYHDVIGKITKDWLSFAFGNGFGTYSFLNPVDWYEHYNNPHNTYLYILYTTGVLGFAVFFTGLAFLVRKAIVVLGSPLDPFAKSLARAVLLVFLCTAVVGLVETDIDGLTAGWLLGTLFGLPLALKRIYQPS
jgi:hypothetical protein